MTVDSRHVNASLRLLDAQRATVQTLTRIRPNIQGNSIEFIANGVQLIRDQVLGNAVLTVVSELVEA